MTVFHTYMPRPPLSAFIESFSWFEAEHSPSLHTKERVLPYGSLQVLINLHEDSLRVYDREHLDRFQSFRGCLICGPQTEYQVIDTTCLKSIMGIHFKPGGAFPFLTLPADELQGLHLPLDTLWGAAAGNLREQLLAADTLEARFHILERTLLAQATQPLIQHPAVAFALEKFQDESRTYTIADVTDQIGLSSRHFIQIFREAVGLTPKLFCRVQRFQKTLRQIRGTQQVDWTDLALSCGYFDQAHFIHDFRAFSGINPGTYLIHQGEYINHVPLQD